MKFRRHHNNKGSRTVRSGKTYDQVRAMSKRLGIPFGRKADGGDDSSRARGVESGKPVAMVRPVASVHPGKFDA